MTITALGLVAVPTPGTPVAAIATSTQAISASFQQREGATGSTYLKDSAGALIHRFRPATYANPPETVQLGPIPSNTFDLATLKIDADVSGDGLVVAYTHI